MSTAVCDDVADYLEEVKVDSDDAEGVLNIVEDTFLDTNFRKQMENHIVLNSSRTNISRQNLKVSKLFSVSMTGENDATRIVASITSHMCVQGPTDVM